MVTVVGFNFLYALIDLHQPRELLTANGDELGRAYVMILADLNVDGEVLRAIALCLQTAMT